MALTTKKPRPGRPGYGNLYKPSTQARMIRRIRITGTERGCWEGICSKRTYYRFKADPDVRDAWLKRVDHAIKDFYNTEILLDPRLESQILKAYIDRLNTGLLTGNEVMKFLTYVRSIKYGPTIY